ncbi:MAG: hypothetical protein ACW9WZ_06775 [Nitrosopumilus sp.]|jgi:hypothetical protein
MAEFSSFIDDVWSRFPVLQKTELTDVTDHNIVWSLDEYVDAGYVNFETDRKELYRLSILIENFAAKNNAPLLATFENNKRYKYVEERYMELLQKLPKAWIIADFTNPSLAPQPPGNTEVLSCDGTNLTSMWIVVSRRSTGPFGLVAEEMSDGKYRGFFTISPMIVQDAINKISKTLKKPIVI